MQHFARRLVEGFPSWQVLLVDLRCHGDSAQLTAQPKGPHGVEASARDILQLLGYLKLFPEVLVGHSFGGKVVMSMAEQFGRMSSRLPKPVQVWVLDALPGDVRAGEAEGQDHPADLIRTLQQMPMPIANRSALQNYLTQRGFSLHVARWTSTNLRPQNGDPRQLVWQFNLDGISDMYQSYEATNLWPLITNTPEGLRINFVKAEHSTFKWQGPEEQVISSYGHAVHLLHKSGHWVHADNPDGLFNILAPYMGEADLHMKRPSQWPSRVRAG
jgi:pimeloyl-ACP methyl ester carboxylesterase